MKQLEQDLTIERKKKYIKNIEGKKKKKKKKKHHTFNKNYLEFIE